MRKLILLALGLAIFVAACDRSGGPVATAPATQTGERLKEDLKTLGRDIKEAATQAATEVKPAVQAATEKGRELIHEGAQKVAEWTDTQPATRR